MSDDFDADLARLEQIRRAHASAKPTDANPAWMNSHRDCGFLLEFIDKLWNECQQQANLAEAYKRDIQ